MREELKVESSINGRLYEDILEIANDDIDWGRLAGKRLLITGAAGFIAYHMVTALLLHNDLTGADEEGKAIRVVGMVRNLDRAKAKYGKLVERDDLELVEQDVCEPFNIETEKSGKVDFVIHAASQASAWHFENDPVGTIKANLVGTSNALDFAKAQNDASGQDASEKTITLIVSSLKTYGAVTDGSRELLEETQGYVDIDSYKNCYATGKRASETLAASYSKQYEMDVKIVRPSYIYGAATLDDDRVWAQFIANVVRGESILLKSAGAPYRSFCYVTDTARAIFRVLLDGENMQPYNISSEIGNVTIRGFAKKAVEAFPERNLTLSFANPEDEAEPIIDYSKQTPEIMNSDRLQSLGWQANVDITEGIKRAVAILENNTAE